MVGELIPLPGVFLLLSAMAQDLMLILQTPPPRFSCSLQTLVAEGAGRGRNAAACRSGERAVVGTLLAGVGEGRGWHTLAHNGHTLAHFSSIVLLHDRGRSGGILQLAGWSMCCCMSATGVGEYSRCRPVESSGSANGRNTAKNQETGA